MITPFRLCCKVATKREGKETVHLYACTLQLILRFHGSISTCRFNYRPKETRPYSATEGAWVHFRLEYVYSVLETLWL